MIPSAVALVLFSAFTIVYCTPFPHITINETTPNSSTTTIVDRFAYELKDPKQPETNPESDKKVPQPHEKIPKPNVPDIKPPDKSAKILMCYYGSWDGYNDYPVDKIDPFLCTHLIYSFAKLENNRITPFDPYMDLNDNNEKAGYQKFVDLKKRNPSLKTMIAIGGWNDGSEKYSAMASNPGSRSVFVQSVLSFLSQHNFDGLDLDWEYPASRGGKPEDKQNFASLVRELRTAFQSTGYLLTAAVSAGTGTVDQAYDVPELSRHLDFINVMTYDYGGGWKGETGLNTPLYSSPGETSPNIHDSVKYWVSKGAQPEKLVLGMATYGQSFTLAGDDRGLKARTTKATQLGYKTICKEFMAGGWTVVRDPHQKAPYAYKGRQWIGYDDKESIRLKSELIKSLRLAGGMFWSLSLDDFEGKCHGQKYPLINTAKQVFGTHVPKDTSPGTTNDVTPKPGTCKELWFNMCESDNDCCIKKCVKDNDKWKHGVCKP